VAQAIKGGMLCGQFFCSGPFITGSEVTENGDYPVKDSRFPGVPDGLGQGGHRVFAAASLAGMDCCCR
jgi:hypothetical protein